MPTIKTTIFTRGGEAEKPNWRFGLSAKIGREQVPELCEALAHIVAERYGGHYYYPDYDNKRVGVAYEWYAPHRGRRFGFKLGVEFWVGEGDLEEIGAYVLYAEDHPKKGQVPDFDSSEQKLFQKKVIETLSLAIARRSQLEGKRFHTVHYIELNASGLLQAPFELPALGALVLPTVLLGKQNTRVSAIVQTVNARFRDEAKQLGWRRFSKLLAFLTLASGTHFQPYRSTLGRTPLKQFVKDIDPDIPLDRVYPAGKYKNGAHWNDLGPWNGLKALSDCYSGLDSVLQSQLDDSIFAYYTAKEVLSKFPTLAVVALVASLKLFRRVSKCEGSVSCSRCGELDYRHDLKGEARSISDSLCEEFGLSATDERRIAIGELVKDIYRTHRSGYVHDAILRHGEFGVQLPAHVPDAKAAISKRLLRQNQLMTIDLLARRAILQRVCRLAGKEFDSAAYGIEPDRFKFTVGSAGCYVVGSTYRVGIRAMGRL